MKTQGLSPKAVLAAALPAVTTLVGLLISWVVTGDVDRTALVAALTGVAASLLAGLGAYLGAPGDVVSPPVGPSSDELLGKAVTDAGA